MKNENKRIEYLDALKLIGILAIICIHVAIMWPDAKSLGYNVSNFSEFCRMGVPIFLMVSGALLLNRNYDLRTFFKKRYSRIVSPFILWAIIYVIFILALYLITRYEIMFNYFNNFPLEWSWYFWMIFGVYLGIPILNEFILNKGIKAAEYFSIIFIFSAIFYEVSIFLNVGTFIDLRFFLGPMGYIVLGYYLANKRFEMNPKWILFISLILFIITSLIKAGWNIMPIGEEINVFKTIHDYSHLVIADPNLRLLSFMDVNIFEIVQAGSVFMIIKTLYEFDLRIPGKRGIKKFILSVSKASYGMYLIQVIFIIILNQLLAEMIFTGSQIAVLILVLSIATFILSWICVLIINKIPLINKLSGYY